MTALRRSAILELEKILYNDTDKEREEAFERLEQLRKKGTVTDDKAELASYREEKYGR